MSTALSAIKPTSAGTFHTQAAVNVDFGAYHVPAVNSGGMQYIGNNIVGPMDSPCITHIAQQLTIAYFSVSFWLEGANTGRVGYTLVVQADGTYVYSNYRNGISFPTAKLPNTARYFAVSPNGLFQVSDTGAAGSWLTPSTSAAPASDVVLANLTGYTVGYINYDIAQAMDVSFNGSDVQAAALVTKVTLSPLTSIEGAGETSIQYTGSALLSDGTSRTVTPAFGSFSADIGAFSGMFGVFTDPNKTSVVQTANITFTIPANAATGQPLVRGVAVRAIPSTTLLESFSVLCTVKDSAGVVVPNCAVQVESFDPTIAKPQYQNYFTNSVGQFSLRALSVGLGATTFRVYALDKVLDIPVSVSSG